MRSGYFVKGRRWVVRGYDEVLLGAALREPLRLRVHLNVIVIISNQPIIIANFKQASMMQLEADIVSQNAQETKINLLFVLYMILFNQSNIRQKIISMDQIKAIKFFLQQCFCNTDPSLSLGSFYLENIALLEVFLSFNFQSILFILQIPVKREDRKSIQPPAKSIKYSHRQEHKTWTLDSDSNMNGIMFLLILHPSIIIYVSGLKQPSNNIFVKRRCRVNFWEEGQANFQQFDDHLSAYNLFFLIIIIQYREMKSHGFDRVRFNRSQQKLIFGSASMKYLPLHHETPLLRQEKTLITIPLSQTTQEIKIYEWRAKTEFPIVKVVQFYYKQGSSGKTTFEVQVEKIAVRLADLRDVSLFKMLYLLKESLIGFERLFHLYGPFMVTAKMIGLNMANKCKVWLNDNFASNTCKSFYLDERSFLSSLYRLFESRGNKLKNTLLFFQQLNQCKTFYCALAFIENYARSNKISILTSCKVTDKEIQKIIEKKTFQGSLTMKELPKSFTDGSLRVSLEHQSKNPLLGVGPSFNIIQNEEEHQQISSKLKKSEETAAEFFEKKSSGLQVQDQFFLQNRLLSNQNPNEPLARSQFQPKLKPNLNFVRKFSEQYPCLTPNKFKNVQTSPSKLQPRLPRSKWNQNSFVNCEYEEKPDFANVFTQNKWEKTLNGLFTDFQDDGMKKSFHQGKEQRKTGEKFDLLDRFGKIIRQSLTHQDELNQN